MAVDSTTFNPPRATNAELEAIAAQVGLTRQVENDASLRRRVELALRAPAMRQTDRIFYALRAALPDCGFVIAVRPRSVVRPTLWQLVKHTLLRRPLPPPPARLIVGVYVPEGVTCSLSLVSDVLREHAPAGVGTHVVVHGNDFFEPHNAGGAE